MKGKSSEFILVDKNVLPPVISKVLEAKLILAQNPGRSVQSVVEDQGISRSAYYKYKDNVHPFYEASYGRVITVIFVVEDVSGILSNIINIMARANLNIVTINQNMPINGLADISISVETNKMDGPMGDLIGRLKAIPGVRKCEIIARD